MTPVLAISLAASLELPLLTVAHVRANGGLSGKRIKLWCLRKGEWCQSVEVDSDVVEWSKLLPADRVEMVR